MRRRRGGSEYIRTTFLIPTYYVFPFMAARGWKLFMEAAAYFPREN